MKKQFLLYAIALLVSGPGATAAVEYEGYTNPAGNKFPIAVYDNVGIRASDGSQILSDAEQKAYFDTIRLAGFNVELWGKEDIWRKGPINKWGSYLKSLGMNTIISTRGFTLTRSKIPYDANTPDSILLQDNWDGLKTVITNYRQDPNVWGYWVSDEPTVRSWTLPVYELNTDEGAVIPTFDMVNKYKGDKVAFANFVAKSNKAYIGHFATDNPGNSYVENFENYLDYMVDLFKLKFLTFDLYPVISNYPGHEPAWIIKSEYYNMMDLYGRYCRDRKIPIWLVMLSVEHSYDGPGEDKDWAYPEITEGLLRMQAMNGLAFGMKGLVYWEYGAKGEMSGNTLYKSALYDINKRQKTSAWDAAKSVNNEVAQYGKYLMDATYDRSCLVTNDTVHFYDGFDRTSESFYDIRVTKHSGNTLLLSHLTADDSEYVAIVNQDHLKSQKITLARNTKKNYYRVGIIYPAVPSPFDPYNTTNTDDNPMIRYESFVLEPGAMILFKRTI